VSFQGRPDRLTWRIHFRSSPDAVYPFPSSAQGRSRFWDEGVPAPDRAEVIAGWVSVLMALKAAADHGVDLFNHDPRRTWTGGFADN
jgi:hypothetical protein